MPVIAILLVAKMGKDLIEAGNPFEGSMPNILLVYLIFYMLGLSSVNLFILANLVRLWLLLS
jgi:hypothetical protein